MDESGRKKEIHSKMANVGRDVSPCVSCEWVGISHKWKSITLSREKKKEEEKKKKDLAA